MTHITQAIEAIFDLMSKKGMKSKTSANAAFAKLSLDGSDLNVGVKYSFVHPELGFIITVLFGEEKNQSGIINVSKLSSNESKEIDLYACGLVGNMNVIERAIRLYLEADMKAAPERAATAKRVKPWADALNQSFSGDNHNVKVDKHGNVRLEYNGFILLSLSHLIDETKQSLSVSISANDGRGTVIKKEVPFNKVQSLLDLIA